MNEEQLKQEFAKIAGQFEKVDGQFEKVNEQFEKVDGQFEKVNEQFEKVDQQFEKVNERFEKVAEQFNEQLATFFGQFELRMNQRFDQFRNEVKADNNRLQATMDGIVKRLDDDEQERAAMNRQLDRHEKWITRAAPKLDVSYDSGA